MTDVYGSNAAGLDSPAIGGFDITPSDSTIFDQPTRGIWVGGAGDVKVVTVDGTSFTYQAVPAGTQLGCRATKVLASGTTATKLSGQY